MNKYMKIFLLAAVLVGTTVSIASCDKDELNAPPPQWWCRQVIVTHNTTPNRRTLLSVAIFLYIVQVACN